MRDMKDSGVAWIGAVPSDYRTASIGSLFTIKKDIIGRDPETVLSITQTGIRPKNLSSNEGQNASSYAHYQIVNVGDFAMNHMDLLTGWIDISKYEGVTSPDYRVFTLNDQEMSADYFLRVFQYYYTNKVFFGFGQGVATLGRWRLPAINFKKIDVPVPPVLEQQRIVAAIDEKVGKVDTLIANVQAQIEKLKAYKQSVITEVVTKGLDPSVPMKDSWVENQDVVPVHWNYVRGRFVAPVNKSVAMPDGETTITYAPMECVRNDSFTPRTIQVKNLSSGLSVFSEGDVLLAKITPCFENGNVAIATNLVNGVGAGSSELIAFSPKGINARFFMYYLQNIYFVESGKATIRGIGGLRRITSLFVDNIALYMPDEVEQRMIVAYLDEKCQQINQLIAIKQKKIDKLNEYKKSLIYEYVTGKKEAAL